MAPVYYEIAPPLLLRSFIKTFWVLRGDFSAPFTYRIFPDCCCDIIFNLNPPFGLSFCPAQKTYFDIIFNGDVRTAGIRFLPGGLQALVKSADRGLVLESRLVRDLERVQMEHIFTDTEVFVRHIAESISLHAVNAESDKMMAYWLSGKYSDVNSISEYFGCSSKTVTRNILRLAGINPARLNRIRRFQNAVFNLNNKNGMLDALYESGYYDQSHFIRDFREFSGFIPSEFIRRTNTSDVRFIQFPTGVV